MYNKAKYCYSRFSVGFMQELYPSWRVLFSQIDQMFGCFLIGVIVLGTSGCASSSVPLAMKDCYITVVDEENDSYAQLCFAEPPDARGETIFYTRNTLLNKQGRRAGVCKQKFDSVTKGEKIYLKTKIARCGFANTKDAPLTGKAYTGVSFRSDVDYCWFDEKKSLICKEKGSNKQHKFQCLKKCS